MSQTYSCPNCQALNRLPDGQMQQGKAAKIVCGKCKKPLFPGVPVHTTDFDFAVRVEQSPLPVLIDFWAPWCGPCQMLGPELEKLAATTEGRLLVIKVNIDENPQLASRFNIRSVPTMMIMSQGQVVDTLMGAMPASAILQKLEGYLR